MYLLYLLYRYLQYWFVIVRVVCMYSSVFRYTNTWIGHASSQTLGSIEVKTFETRAKNVLLFKPTAALLLAAVSQIAEVLERVMKLSDLFWIGRNNKIVFVKVSVQGVVALGGHFARLCQEVDFYESIFFSLLIFKKRKGKYFYTFNHSYSEKSSNRAT